MSKILVIPRLISEGEVNPNSGRPYDTESFNKALLEYIHRGPNANCVSLWRPNPYSDIDQILTIDLHSVIGYIVGFDKDTIHMKPFEPGLKSLNIDIENLEHPVVLFSILATNEKDKSIVNRIGKVELATLNMLDTATRQMYLNKLAKKEIDINE